MLYVCFSAIKRKSQSDGAELLPVSGPCCTGFVSLFICSIAAAFAACLVITGHNPLAQHSDFGYPEHQLTWQRLDTWYPATEGPNAADIYVRAFCEYQEDEYSRNFELILTDHLSDLPNQLSRPQAKRILDLLNQNSESLALIERATGIKQCRFDVCICDNGEPYLSYHHQDMRIAARLLYLAAVSELDRKRTAEACQRVAQIMCIADAIYQEPTLISAYTSFRVREDARDLAERLLISGQLTDQDLTQLKDMLRVDHTDVPAWYLELNTRNSNNPVIIRLAHKYRNRILDTRDRVINEQTRRAQGRFPHVLGDLSPA